MRSSVFFAPYLQPTMQPPQWTQRSKSTATSVGRNVDATPIRSATRLSTASAGVSNGTGVAPSIVLTVA